MASVRTFSDLVRGQAVAVQAAAAGLVDFTVGSIPRAFADAFAQVALWLQAQVLVLLATTRASTSSGPDLDSWMADFGLFRLLAQLAVGSVTFGRLSTSQPATVPLGTTVASADGSQRFQVIADPSNSAYTPLGYRLASGVASVTVPVQAVTIGAAGNAVAGSVTLITQAVVGIDTVTNTLAFAGGLDAESDAAFRTRFRNYLGSLARATRAALLFAIASVQQGVTAQLVENTTYAGGAQPGSGYAVVDDGTGAPSAGLLAAAAAAVDLVRPFTVSVAVFPPVIVTVSASMTLSVADGYDKPTIAAAVQAAVTAYITGLGLGNSLPFTRLPQIAYDTSPGVLNVIAPLLNGATADITASPKQTLKPGTITVSAP